MKGKVPPFYPNRKDNLHCSQAVTKMILKYFQPNKNYSWKEIDKLTGFKKGLWTWPMQIQTNMAKVGFEIHNKDFFDYKKLARMGGKYMIQRYGKEVGEAQIKNSDIPAETKKIKKYLENVDTENAIPTLSDVKKFLQKGFLVSCNINPRVLSKKRGYVGHLVLVYKVDDKYVHLHDPGLPPLPRRKATKQLFNKAWGYPSASDKSMTAFRLESK